jgi:hypothetical protein
VVRFVHVSGAEGAKTVSEVFKAEDSGHTSGDFGLQVLTVRQDTAAALGGTDADYQPLITDANGRLHVIAALAASQTLATVTTVGTVTTVSTVTAVTTVSTVTNVATIGTSVTPGTGAAHLGKAEDAAHASGDTGVFVLAVRSDTAAATGQTDGDYTALVTDSSGRLHVNVGNTVTVGSHAVTNAGTFAVQVDGAALTALQLIDDAVYADDADWTDDASKHLLVGGLYQSTPQTVTDGDVAPFNITANGALHVAVQGTVTVGSHAVTNAGTFAVQVDGSALTALQLIDDIVFTDDAVFTPGTSKLAVVGAQADETAADSVDEGDAGALRMTLDRFLRVAAELTDSVRVGATTRAVSRAAVAAATSGNNTLVTNSNGGLKVRVFALTLVAAGAVNLYFTSDAGGSVIFGGSTNKINLAANGGFVLPFNPAGWFETSADHDVVMNLSGAVAVSGGIVYAEV